MMMSIATFAFVVFGIASTKLLWLFLITATGFGGLLYTIAPHRSHEELTLILIAYLVCAVFITVINAYVGNLQAFLSKQNRLIKLKSDELELTQTALMRAKEDAEESSRSKTRFLAAASHDLRQPLHALELYIGVLAEQPGKAPEHVLTRMKKSAYELRELLNSLFDISRFDAQVADVNVRRVRLDQIVEDLEVEFKDLSEKMGRPLTVRPSHAIVRTDPILMHRIIRGLVNNALTHAQKGRVLLGFRSKGDRIRCEVWDSGIGIAPENQSKIFEEFYQVKNAHRDRAHGLGLGLALIQRMCHALNHKFGMRSVPGRGSVFWVEMTRADIADEYEHEPLNMPQASLAQNNQATLLCIDDETAILDGLQLLLAQWGYRVVIADNVTNALLVLQKGAITPDLILCDYRLAENTNGIDAIRQINVHLQQNIPGLLITGDLDQNIEHQAKHAGLRLLRKPLNPAKLKLYLQRMLAKGLDEASA